MRPLGQTRPAKCLSVLLAFAWLFLSWSGKAGPGMARILLEEPLRLPAVAVGEPSIGIEDVQSTGQPCALLVDAIDILDAEGEGEGEDTEPVDTRSAGSSRRHASSSGIFTPIVDDRPRFCAACPILEARAPPTARS